MKLLADGIYIPIVFERFSLVEEIYQLINLPSIAESLYFVKVLITNKVILTTVH